MSDNLHTLSFEELKEQARILGVPAKGSADTLRTKIQAVLDGEDPKTVKEKKEPVKKDRKADWVTIQISEKEGDNQPVFVGHNGSAYFIRRGEPVQVPPVVVEVLKHANQKVRARKPGTDNEYEWKTVPSYPFQVLS